MKGIDDLTFTRFVNNLLSQDEMVHVEKQLIVDGEASATVYASISNFEANQELAEIVFEQEEEKMEVNAGSISKDDSMLVNSETKTFNNSIMNVTISKEETLKIREFFTACKESANTDLTFEENLTNFYLNQFPGILPESAKDVVENIKKGVLVFNENLNKALSEEGIDYIAEIKQLGENLTNEQKYELYINYLSAIHVLNVQNFDIEHASQIDDFDSIKKEYEVVAEVSDDMLDDVIMKITDALNNNTLCLTSIEMMKQLQGSLAGGSDKIKDILRGSEADFQNKVEMSLATYIAYRQGEIESLKNHDVMPEVIAIAISSGIEQAQVVENVRTGKTTVDTAIGVLKVLGGVALWTTLTLAIACISIYLVSFAFGAFVSLLGTSILGLIIASVAALACSLGIFNCASEFVDETIDWAGSAFDWIVDGWRETVWPTIKEKTSAFIVWLGDLFANRKVVPTTQTTPISTVVAEG